MTEQLIKFDKRVILRNLQKGVISQSQLDEYLKSLPDMTSEAEELCFDSDEEADADETTKA